MPTALAWLSQWMKRGVASGLSLVAHGVLVFGVAMCPPRPAPRLLLTSMDSITRRAAPPRLIFLTPPMVRPAPSPSRPRAVTRSRASAPAITAALSTAIVTETATHGSADTAGMLTGPPVPARVDSGPPNVVDYERPVHPALRGLVPMWNGGAIWRGMISATSLVPALRPRPADCARGAPGYFACVDRLQRWRDDSIYHVRVRCQPDPRRVGQRFPPDCGRFRSDSTPD